MRVGNGTGKGMSGMNKLGSIIDRMYMKLGSKFFSSLRVKTQLLDGATHSQKDGVAGNGGSLKDGAEAFVLFLQLVLCPHKTFVR